MAHVIVGVMGPGNAPERVFTAAEQLGKLIAEEGWTLLTGGRDAGVMKAASKGAKSAGGLTIGILPGSDRTGMSEHVDIPVVTGLGSARNNINVLSSDVVIACGTGAGTLSEVMLAIKSGKKVILLHQSETIGRLMRELGAPGTAFATTPAEAVELIHSHLKQAR